MPPNFRNPTYTDLRQGFDDRMAALGQPFELLRTGETFRAIAINVPPIDPRLELGSDLREHCTIEALRDRLPVGIKHGDVIKQTNPPFNTSTFQEFPIWKVIKREDNGANFTIRYWAVKVPQEEEEQVLKDLATA